MKSNIIRTYLTLLILGVSSAAYSDHKDLPPGVDPLMATWLWGYYTIPASITRDNSAYWYGYSHFKIDKINNPAWTTVAEGHIQPGQKAPAVLVMHGCAGIARGPGPNRIFFMERGFAVFEPDSFARPDREPCGGNVLDLRIEELEFALERIRELPWIDQDRLILMGISEGGAAVAAWDQPGFAAHIIEADNCERGGHKTPEGVPVLAIIGEKDSNGGTSSCKIDRKIGGSKSIVIPGGQHDVSSLPETEQAIDEFLSHQGS